MLLPTCSVNYPNASSTSYGTCAEIWISRLSLWTKKRLKVKADYERAVSKLLLVYCGYSLMMDVVVSLPLFIQLTEQ